jgi:hypothetical protein
MILRRTWLIVALVSVCSGCVQTGAGTVARSAPKVKLDGYCIELDDGVKPTPDELLGRIDEHLKANRRGPATLLIDRFPDVAQTCYLSSASGKAADFLRMHHQTSAGRYAAMKRSCSPESFFILHPFGGLQPPPTNDPILGERIATQFTNQADWLPAPGSGPSIAEWLGGKLASENVVGPDALASLPPAQAVAWLTIGHWRLERGEPKSALAALKKAETADTTGVWREWTQLQQGKALMQLGQSPAAVTILTGLAETASPPCRLAALATLGACKFRDGHVQQSLIFLKKAVEESKDAFPGRAEAEADLGLAYLSTGDESSGLDHLHAAQKSFAEKGRGPSLWLSLENEVSYLRHVGRTEDASRVEARLREEQSH